jgi:hypothetical protein
MAHTSSAARRGQLFYYGQNDKSRRRALDAVRTAENARAAAGGAGTGGAGGADSLNLNIGGLVLPHLGRSNKVMARPGPYIEWAKDERRLDLFQAEVSALVELFRLTHGSNWHKRANWCDPAVHIKDWHGVVVAGGHVRELRLTSNNLNGHLPEGLRALRKLERLLIADNRIGGTLPSLKGMTRLIEVDCGHNRLAGTASGNDAPPSRQRLPKLMHFVCHHNAFSFAPPPGAERVSLLHERTVLSTGKPGTRHAVPERTTVRYKTADQVWVTHDIEKAPAFKVPRGRIIVKEPDEVEAQRLLLRAQELFNGGRLLDAAADYGRVIRLKPEKGFPYHGRAACLFATINWKDREAYRAYEECLRLVQKSMEADRRERRAPCAETKVLIEPAANIALLRKMARDLLKKFSTEQKRGVVKIQALARGVGLRASQR